MKKKAVLAPFYALLSDKWDFCHTFCTIFY